jgi:hypothetical protein
MRAATLHGRRCTVAIAVAVLALAAAEIPLDLAAHVLSVSNTGFALMIAGAFAAVGVLVVARLPRNPVGWLFSAFALLVLIGDCSGDYALLGYRYGHHALPLRGAAAVVATIASVAPILLLPPAVMLFPDAQLPLRWRRALRAYAAVACGFLGALLAGALVAASQRHVSIQGNGTLAGANASSGATGWLGAVKTIALIPAVPLGLSPLVRQYRRYRRSGGLERVQLKWLVAGAVASMAAVAYFVAGLGDGNSALADTASAVAGALFAALPLSMGVAILRYRLYDIDRLISRTLAYAILTGLLAGTFIGVIALSTDVLPFSSRVGVVASTLVAAALFNPLRARVQRLVDRRFNRARYDSHATVAAFTARLRDAVELETVRSELIDTVRDAVQPSHVSLWLR